MEFYVLKKILCTIVNRYNVLFVVLCYYIAKFLSYIKTCHLIPILVQTHYGYLCDMEYTTGNIGPLQA